MEKLRKRESEQKGDRQRDGVEDGESNGEKTSRIVYLDDSGDLRRKNDRRSNRLQTDCNINGNGNGNGDNKNKRT